MRSTLEFRSAFCLLLALLLLPAGSAGAAKLLDPGFGTRGRVVTNVGLNEVSRGARLTEVQPVAGAELAVSVVPDTGFEPVTALRFDSEDSLDKSFGDHGWRTLRFGSLTRTTSEGMLVASPAGNGAGGKDITLRMLNDDGSLNRGFGTEGTLRIRFNDLNPSGARDTPKQIVIGSTGEILISANITCSERRKGCGYNWGGFGLALVTPDGRLIREAAGEDDQLGEVFAAEDGTYRLTGILAVEAGVERTGLFRIDRRLRVTAIRQFDGIPEWSGPIAMRPGNGFFAFADQGGGITAIVRVLADGQIDPAFSPVGCPRPDLIPGSSARRLAIDAKGRLLAGGVGACNLMRVLPGGGLDSSFGEDGIVDLFPTFGWPVWGAVPGPDGSVRIVIWENDGGRLVLRRLTETGTPDPGSPGRTVLIRQASDDVGRAVLGNKRYVVAGNSSCAGRQPWSSTCQGFFLAGYTARGKLNRNFGDGGFTRGGFMRVNALARTPDGALIAAGSATRKTGPWKSERTDLALARFSAKGKLDPGFGEQGLVVTEIPGGLDRSRALAVRVRKDGRIIVTGEVRYKTRSQSQALPVLRYKSNGQLDPGFGDGGLALVGPGRLGDGHAISLAGRRILIGTQKGFKRPAIVRLKANGSLDRAFGRAGIALPRFAVRSRFEHGERFRPFRDVRALKVLRGGEILATADDGYESQDGVLFKLKRNGKADRQFGRKGVVYTGGLGPRSLSTDRCGRITVAGPFRRSPHSRRNFAISRFRHNGRIDPHFARRRFAFPFGRQRPSTAAASVGGRRTVVVGSVKRESTQRDLAVAALRNKRRCR